MNFFIFLQIPLSLGYVGANVLSLLTDDALIAQWNNEGGFGILRQSMLM